MRELLTSSRLKAARQCVRKHDILYRLQVRPAIEADALRFGTLVHKGLESWWLARSDRLAHALAAITGEADPFDHAKAEALLRGYDARWGGETFEVLTVEAQFQTRFVNPDTGRPSDTYDLGGKIDAIVRMDGKTYVVEHKTSSDDIRAGSGYWKRLRLDGQVSTYFAGAKALGFDVDGCLYDVLGKPSIRPKDIPVIDEDGVKVVLDRDGLRARTKDGKKWRQTSDAAEGLTLSTRPETPDEYLARCLEDIASDPEAYFQRGIVVRLAGEVDEAMADSWALARTLADLDRAGRSPRNPDACVSYGQTCAFFDACTGAASLDDPTRFRRLATAHPELESTPIAA